MNHPIYRVVFFEIQGPYTLRVCFDDDTEQVIDFRPTLEGELFGIVTHYPSRTGRRYGWCRNREIEPEK